MSRFIKAAALLLAFAAGSAAGAAPGLGRPATPAEIAAWDTDVRADFKGLPKGSGSVAKGMQTWEAKCASCHGSFGESNEVFTPIIGGTTADDIKTGRVASLTSNKQPHKTTMMKLATISTLWDYINRAMPWTNPKSLSVDEVYGLTAYILNMAEVVGDDFVLSDQNIADVQKRLPNRNGMGSPHGLWDIKGKPDVKSIACMKDCPVEATIRSALPAAARNAHGNIAQQNRSFGATRGVDSGRPAAAPAPADAMALLNKNSCLACHGVASKIVGPALRDIGNKYAGKADAATVLAASIRNGSAGRWGAIPMPAQAQLKDDDLNAIVGWILAGPK